jgi:putative ABC transport system permease protein
MHDRISFGGGVVKDTLVLGVSPQYQQHPQSGCPVGRFLDDDRRLWPTSSARWSPRFCQGKVWQPGCGRRPDLRDQRHSLHHHRRLQGERDDFGQSEIADQTILIPYSVARYFTGTENVKQIYFSMRSMDEVPDAQKEIVRIVQSRHRPNSVYKAQTLKELLTMAAQIANALTAVLVLVATVTLAVGGVGIMNIMLANVRSRIREIGIRKALGATRREIKLQFLSEAIIISLVGGIVGTIVGLALPLSVRFFTDYAIAGLALVGRRHCPGRGARWWESSSARFRPRAPPRWIPWSR